jgi:ankyrin repeat protein
MTNSRDKQDRTPPLRTAARGHEAIVKLLIDQDEVTAGSKDKDSRTLLWCAAKGGHEGVIKCHNS